MYCIKQIQSNSQKKPNRHAKLPSFLLLIIREKLDPTAPPAVKPMEKPMVDCAMTSGARGRAGGRPCAFLAGPPTAADLGIFPRTFG